MKEKEQERLEIKDGLEDPDLSVDRTQRLKDQLDKIEKIYGLTRRRFLKIEETAVETDIDRKIEEIEAGFFRFGEKVLPLIETIDDSYLRKLLKMPFDLVAHNAKVNKERNVQTLIKNTSYGTDGYYISVYTIQFFYEFKKMSFTRAAASFTPLSRKITLSEGFDSNNDVDNLILFHEMIHAYNDSVARLKLKSKEQWEAYHAFFKYRKDGEVPRVDIADESIAVACELEVLNLLLDGELEKTVRDSGRLDIKEIGELLNVRSIGQIRSLRFMINASSLYFKGTRKNMVFSKPFLDFIASIIREQGRDPVISNGGGISPYL